MGMSERGVVGSVEERGEMERKQEVRGQEKRASFSSISYLSRLRGKGR